MEVEWDDGCKEKINHHGSKNPSSCERKREKGLYAVRVQKACHSKAPKRLIFDLVEGIPREEETESKTAHTCGGKRIHNVYPGIPEKIDVYYFDHGNAAYYQTTDNPPPILAELIIEKSDSYATWFWAEIFGWLHLLVAFVTVFILQLIRFWLHSVLRPLTVGIIQLISDYFLKPLLTILFNGLIQPCLILLYNIATSFRDVCEPLAQALGFWTTNLGILFQSIRLVDTHKRKCNHCPYELQNKDGYECHEKMEPPKYFSPKPRCIRI